MRTVSLSLLLILTNAAVALAQEGGEAGGSNLVALRINLMFWTHVIFLILFFMFIRWTVPRFRYDQLMKLGWVWMFELALANILIAAVVIAFTR